MKKIIWRVHSPFGENRIGGSVQFMKPYTCSLVSMETILSLFLDPLLNIKHTKFSCVYCYTCELLTITSLQSILDIYDVTHYVYIRRSKTDPFRARAVIGLRPTGDSTLYPVVTLDHLLRQLPPGPTQPVLYTAPRRAQAVTLQTEQSGMGPHLSLWNTSRTLLHQ